MRGAYRERRSSDSDTSTAWHIQVEAISTVALVRRSVTDQDPTPAVLPARVCMMIVGELSDVDRGQLPILFELVPGGR